MNSLRDSIASIPGALTNFISDSASTASTYIQRSSATPTSQSTSQTISDGDGASNVTHSEKSLPIPASLVKEQWRLIFTSDANVQDLEAAIAHCRDLVLLTDECSEERKWLVRHLVDLRFSLKELKDAEEDPNENGPSVKTVVGHHFVVHQRSGRLQTAATCIYCDHCTGIIWSVVQASYICSDCNFLAHQKCVDSVVRVCAHVVVTERQYPIPDICPEIGLAAQHYKCAECETLLNCSKLKQIYIQYIYL